MDISADIIAVIQKLLPGFVAAWVFYGLTIYVKPSPFERVIQAFIFMALLQPLQAGARYLMCLIGEHAFSLGPWDETAESAWAVGLAVGLGLVFARWANNNSIHSRLFEWDWYDKSLRKAWGLKWLPRWRWTSRTSHPSEWYSALNSRERYVILHLKGDKPRRIYGWPREWPNDPSNGHFLLNQAKWLLDDGGEAILHNVDVMLIAASDVEMVEIILDTKDQTVPAEMVLAVQQKMVSLQKGASDGIQIPEGAAESLGGGPESCAQRNARDEQSATTAGRSATVTTTISTTTAKALNDEKE